MMHISFGTSGWRGILGEDFTFDNVKIVIKAIADNLKSAGEDHKGVVVSCDTRFMGQRFVQEASRVLAGEGITAFLCERDTPTPVISFEILRRKAAAASTSRPATTLRNIMVLSFRPHGEARHFRRQPVILNSGQTGCWERSVIGSHHCRMPNWVVCWLRSIRGKNT